MRRGDRLSEAAAFVRGHAEGVAWRALEPAVRGLGIALAKAATPLVSPHAFNASSALPSSNAVRVCSIHS